jgi:thioredoxin-like negative regulator of GroEL
MRSLMYFSAPWCVPCKALKPIVAKLEAETKIHVERVDVDTEAEKAMAFDVQGVPTVLFIVDGKVIDGITGATPPSIVKLTKFVKGD